MHTRLVQSCLGTLLVVDHPSVDGRERQDKRGLVGRGVKEEFCVKVLKFKIMNSLKLLFNYFSEVVPRTIEFVHPVLLLMGGLKMASLKIDRTTLDL